MIGIDIADHVGDGHVRRGQLLDVALVAMQPRDGRLVALFRDQVAAAAADGPVRIIVNLAAGDVGRPFVEQRGQHADQARFGLPAQAQQNEIMPGKNGVDHLRHNGVFIAHDPGKQLFAALNAADQIIAKLVLDRAGWPNLASEKELWRRAPRVRGNS